MMELLPFDDEAPSPLDEVAEQMDSALDASFLADMAAALEQVKRARERIAAALA